MNMNYRIDVVDPSQVGAWGDVMAMIAETVKGSVVGATIHTKHPLEPAEIARLRSLASSQLNVTIQVTSG